MQILRIKNNFFFINMISNLLRKTTVQHTAQIIGHSDIKSTMSYSRYALSKDEIQELLDSRLIKLIVALFMHLYCNIFNVTKYKLLLPSCN